MEGIKNWVTVLMVSAVVGEMILLIAPPGNISKVLKIAVSVFFLGCFLTPFATLGNEGLEKFSFDYQSKVNSNTSALDETMQQQILDQFQKNIVQIISVNLDDLDVSAQKIEVAINMQEDTSIQMECINIWLDSSYQAKEKIMTDQLHSVFGYKTQILFHYEESDDEG